MSRWIFRGLMLIALSFANLNDIWSPDVVPNALLVYTLLGEGDVDYDEFAAVRPCDPADRSCGAMLRLDLDRESYFFRACGASTATAPPTAARSIGGPPAPGPSDRVCSIFPPGIGIVALPAFAPFAIAGPVPGLPTLVRVGHAAAAVIEAIATLLLWSVLLRFVSPRWALALILLYALGTSVRTVASQALWQHAGVHLFVAWALWLVLRREQVSAVRELAAGVLLGLGVVVRQTTGLFVFLWGTRRLPLLAGVALGALPLLAYNVIAFGSALEQGYGAKPLDAPVLAGLYGLLLSPSRGLFVYEPWTLFALAALVLAWRRGDPVALRLRGAALTVLAFVGLYASYAEWWGGRVFGPRFLDDLAPLLVAALAWGIGEGLLRARWARIAFWVSAAWSWLLFNAAALAYSNERWDMTPTNVNFTPERLFDWSDPQWLAVLRDAAAGGPRVAVALALSALVLVLFLRSEGVLRRSIRSAA